MALTEQLTDIRLVLREQLPAARLTLSKHVGQIVMRRCVRRHAVIKHSMLLRGIGIDSENARAARRRPEESGDGCGDQI